MKWIVKQHIFSKKWLAYREDYDEFSPATLLDDYSSAARVFRSYAEAVKYVHTMACSVSVDFSQIPRIGKKDIVIDNDSKTMTIIVNSTDGDISDAAYALIYHYGKKNR